MKLVAVTDDLEAAEEILSSTYGPVRISPRGPRRGLRLEQAPFGHVEFHHVNVAMDLDAAGTLGALVFAELTAGRVREGANGGERRYGPGEVCLAARPGCLGRRGDARARSRRSRSTASWPGARRRRSR